MGPFEHAILFHFALTICFCSYVVGLGPIPNILCSEIFPTKARATCANFCSLSFWFGGLLSAYCFPVMMSTIGLGGACGIYALVCCAPLFPFYYRIPSGLRALYLSDNNFSGREEFEQHVHMLHGDRSPNRLILDWQGRLKIAVGVARGLAFLHERLGLPAGRLVSMDGADFDAPPPHGNLKSGNILLGEDMEPRLVDFGFFPLVNAAQAPQAMFAFRSPEGTTRGVVSARSDVYCLGVVLLELVTGRFPSQYLLSARGGTDVVHWAATAVAEGGEAELVDPAIAAAGGDTPAVHSTYALVRVLWRLDSLVSRQRRVTQNS